MTFLYVVHVYMFCNIVLYCIDLPARVLFAIKIIVYYYYISDPNIYNNRDITEILLKVTLNTITLTPISTEIRFAPKMTKNVKFVRNLIFSII